MRTNTLKTTLIMLIGGAAFCVFGMMKIVNQLNIPTTELDGERDAPFFGLNPTGSVAEEVPNFSDLKGQQGRRRISNFTYIYYQHVRKCAGTVGQRLVRGKKSGVKRPYKVLNNEYHAFPASCIHAPEANQTLFFTMLRDPAERYASEFRYQKLHHHYNLTNTTTSEEVRTAVQHWVDNSKKCMKAKGWRRDCFYPDMYVRLFSGKDRCRVYEAPANTTTDEIFLKWAGSSFNIGTVTEQDYLFAFDILKQFDVVFTTEKLGPSAGEKWNNLGLSTAGIVNWSTLLHPTVSSFDILSYDGVREILEEHLQYDMRIFQYFDSIQ